MTCYCQWFFPFDPWAPWGGDRRHCQDAKSKESWQRLYDSHDSSENCRPRPYCVRSCENLHRGQHRPGTSHGTSDVLQVLWNSEILKFWNKHWWWLMVTDGHWCHMSRLEEKNIQTKKKHRGFEDLLQMHVKPTVDSTSAPWRRTEQDAQELKLPEKNCRIHQTTKYYTHCKTAISCSTYINSRSRWSNQ